MLQLEMTELKDTLKVNVLVKQFTVMSNCMLELNTEKEGFMAYTAPEDALRPRAVYAVNPDFRGI